jgi:hypothetical protein
MFLLLESEPGAPAPPGLSPVNPAAEAGVPGIGTTGDHDPACRGREEEQTSPSNQNAPPPGSHHGQDSQPRMIGDPLSGVIAPLLVELDLFNPLPPCRRAQSRMNGTAGWPHHDPPLTIRLAMCSKHVQHDRSRQ